MSKAKLPRKTIRALQVESIDELLAALTPAKREAVREAVDEELAGPIGDGDDRMNPLDFERMIVEGRMPLCTGIDKTLDEAMRLPTMMRAAAEVGFFAGVSFAVHYGKLYGSDAAIELRKRMRAGKEADNKKRASKAEQRKTQVLDLFAEETKAGKPLKLTNVYARIAAKVGLKPRRVADLLRAEQRRPRAGRGNG